jgi:hypothetical protein
MATPQDSAAMQTEAGPGQFPNRGAVEVSNPKALKESVATQINNQEVFQ